MATKRKRRGAKMRRAEITPAQWAYLNDDEELAYELDVFGILAMQSRREVPDLWRLHRDEVLSQWIVKRPGTRPRLFWEYDAPEPRKERESQRAYLRRHKLLEPSEQQRLARVKV